MIKSIRENDMGFSGKIATHDISPNQRKRERKVMLPWLAVEHGCGFAVGLVRREGRRGMKGQEKERMTKKEKGKEKK